MRRLFLLLVVSAATARAQSPAMSQAMDYEAAGRAREAVTAYRTAMAEGFVLPALLGIERAFAQLGQTDSVVTLVDSLLRVTPRDVTVRTVQLRVLRSLDRDTEARTAYRDWIRASPRDPAPYREWARVLLAEGRSAEADTVLTEATMVLGSTRALALEAAQLRTVLGQWPDAAIAWRDAFAAQPYLESAAIYSLRAAPAEYRRAVRGVLMGDPVTVPARRVLASIELAWGSSREGWSALRDLPPSDEVGAAWSAFAEEAERSGAWLAARDALLALQRWRPDQQRALRAATLALEGGDAASALSLAEYAAREMTDSSVAVLVVPVQLRSYAALGRGPEAQRALDSARRYLAPTVVLALQRDVAWAWVRAGDVRTARAALGTQQLAPDDELAGWLALYEGDLAAARAGLRRADATTGDAVTALAVLVRTAAPRSERIGAAFLALAQRDSALAARSLVSAADATPDAASILLLTAARLHQRQGRASDALALWARIVAQHEATPEASEAELEWGRLLRQQGDRAGAIAHLEHLILTWPQSALVPQARRELELARGSIPPGGRDV
jgi:tetratricopeptide (TPR) repeat protein